MPKRKTRAKPCPFCKPSKSIVRWETPWWYLLKDRYPCVEQHLLLVPKKHVRSVFELHGKDWFMLWDGLQVARAVLENEAREFNIGINDGPLAGQTIEHAHVHIMPRREGDQEDPTGGVRRIFEGKGRYK